MDAADDADAIARAMGFSAFGQPQRPNKKRKFDFSVVAPPNPRPKSNGAVPGSLSSTLPARSSTRNGAGAKIANSEEIDLDDGDEVVHVGGATSWEEAPKVAERGGDDSDGTGGERVSDDEAQAEDEGGGKGGENRRPPSEGWKTANGRPHGHGRTQPWWKGYYDPTSNQNPWERLEQAMGLRPKGPWVPRDAGQHAGARGNRAT